MYHFTLVKAYNEKGRTVYARPFSLVTIKLLAFFRIFAFLVSDTATGLASRLAGSLTFAAAAVFRAVAKVTGFDSLNMFHKAHSFNLQTYEYIIS